MGDDREHVSFGHRLAHLLARNAVDVRGETLKMEGVYRDDWTTAWLERFERELAPVVDDLLGHIRDHPSTPQRLARVIGRGTKPTHQVDAILNVILSAVAAITQIGALTAPFAQKEVNTLWTAHAHRPLDPGTAAGAAMRQAIDVATARDYAASGGFDADAFDAIYQSQFTPPPIEVLLTLVRRKLVSAGSLPAAMQALGVTTDYVDAIGQLTYGPIGPAQAVLGVVQNHLDEASARAVLAENGIDPANYDVLYQNAGRPPGPEQMLNAWNRGVAGVDQSVVEQSIREGDTKDKYVGVLVGLREHLLPQKTVVAGVHQGIIDDATALSELLKLGISPTNAGYLIAEGHNLKTATHKTLSASQIETAYEDGSLTRADAQSHLVTLGYLAADATFILDLVDVKWQTALHNATVTRVKAQYVAGRIDRNTASNELDTIGVAAAHRDLYLAQWTIVASTPTRTLTETQLTHAYREGLLTTAQFRARLTAMGFAAADVDLVVALTPVHLTQAQSLAAFTGGFITETDTRARLAALGLAPDDIDILIREKAPAVIPPGT